MATMNIYLSEDLKQEMDQITDQNWSAVCQQAIRTTINVEKVKTMQTLTPQDRAAIAQRVRTTSSCHFDEGYEIGRDYAVRQANMDDFEFFQTEYATRRQQARISNQSVDKFINEINPPLSGLFDWIGDGDDYHITCMTYGWIDGFVKGLLEVWQEITPELEKEEDSGPEIVVSSTFDLSPVVESSETR